jgi:SIR2-like domain
MPDIPEASPLVGPKQPPTKVSFLRTANGAEGWKSLEPEAAAEDLKSAQLAAEASRKQLSEYLHSVLTAPNLVVLAGSGASLGKAGGPSMADLWDAAVKIPYFKEIAAAVKHPNDDAWIENLLSRCQVAKDFLDSATSKKVADFLSASEKMIWEACSEFLAKADLEGHQTFLRRMARRRLRAPRLKLFTTNYDLCFERAAGDLGITVIDGFSFSQPRRFDARFFTYDIVRRAKGSDESHDFVEGVIQLFKLHGSVDWDDTPDGIVQSAKPKKPCLIYPNTPTRSRTLN